MRRRILFDLALLGDDNMFEGTFTLEANTTDEYTVTLPSPCKNFIFQKINQDVGYGPRCWLGGSKIEGMWDFMITTNAAGTAITSVNTTSYRNIDIIENQVKLKPSNAYPGNLVAETYQWIAW